MSSNFHSWREFLNMGGYALYVWGAYGALVASFILGGLLAWRQRRLVLKDLQYYESAA